MQPRPGRLIALQPQHSLQPQRTGAVPLGGHASHGAEPDMARNQTGKGVRVSWKIVPAATDIWQPQAAHSSSTPRTGHGLATATSIPYRGQKRWYTIFGLIFGIGAATRAFSSMLSIGSFPDEDRRTRTGQRRGYHQSVGWPSCDHGVRSQASTRCVSGAREYQG